MTNNIKVTYERMEKYDGDGWYCYVQFDKPNAEGKYRSNTGFGDTKKLAKASYLRGEDIAEEALKKWSGAGLI